MDTKKILASIAAVAMLGSAIPMAASAALAEDSTSPSSEEIESTEIPTSTEENETKGFHFNASSAIGQEGIEIIGYSDSIEEAIIPAEVNGEAVTSIAKLSGEGTIKKIVIPASVTRIAKNAFSGVKGLEEIEVSQDSESFTSVDGVLYNKDMTQLIICPAGNKNTSLSIADTVTEIAAGAISGVSSLEELTVGEGIKAVDKSLFTNCPNIKKITISASVETIDYEFIKAKTAIAEYNVAEGNSAYSSADGVLYNKDKTVLYAYPAGKDNDKFEVPSSVKEITGNAFEGCSKIGKFTVAKKNSAFASVNGILFTKDVSKLVKYPAVKNDAEYTVPDEVTEIADNAFQDCAALKKVTFGEGMAELKGDPFSGTTAVEEYAVAGNNQNLKAVEGVVYTADGKTLVKYPAGKAAAEFAVAAEIEAIAPCAFANCKNISAYNADDNNAVFSSVNGILFDKEGTTLIKYPSGSEAEEFTVNFNVKAIAAGAFQSAYNLKSVSFKNYETEVADGAFRDMDKALVIFGNKDSAAKIYADANYIDFTAFEGEYSLGDVNNDGAVDALDASHILSEYANIAIKAELSFTPEQTAAGNVLNDNELNALDASYVLSYYAYTATTADAEKLSVRDYVKKLIEENNANAEKPEYDAVSSSAAVAEYLFQQLDDEAIKVGDFIDDEKLAALAGEDSDVYKIAHSYVAPALSDDIDIDNIKGSDVFETEYILSILNKDDELYAVISDAEKLDAMTFDDISNATAKLMEIEGVEKEKLVKPEILEYVMGVWFDSYGFVCAYVLDSDAIIIDNGTGHLLQPEGVAVTRNNKELELTDVAVPEELQYDGNKITISEKVEGYDNVYSWFSGT